MYFLSLKTLNALILTFNVLPILSHKKNICFIKSFSLLFTTPDEVLFCNIISNNHVQYMSQNGKAKGEKVNHVSSKKQLFDGKPFSAKKVKKRKKSESCIFQKTIIW